MALSPAPRACIEPKGFIPAKRRAVTSMMRSGAGKFE
jgi:hypothetical protein